MIWTETRLPSIKEFIVWEFKSSSSIFEYGVPFIPLINIKLKIAANATPPKRLFNQDGFFSKLNV